jgi:hypothetical protein
MANGPQIAEVNYQRFLEWAQDKTDADFKALERRGVISRAEIVKECGFARSALTQNPRIKAALKSLEDNLRTRGVLPPEVETDESNDVPIREIGSEKRKFDADRLRRLEQDNAALKQENAELKRQLLKYTVLHEALALTGRVPR